MRIAMNTTTKKQYSPWGRVQSKEVITPWLYSVATSSHGGLKLNREYNAKIPAIFRKKGGWYEEDCALEIVVLFLHAQIEKDGCGSVWFTNDLERAKQTVKEYYPYEYEEHFNVVLQRGESRIKDEDAFKEANKHNFFAFCNQGMQNNVKSHLRCSATGEEICVMFANHIHEAHETPYGAVYTQEEVLNLRKATI
jgi:hypothetical protein